MTFAAKSFLRPIPAVGLLLMSLLLPPPAYAADEPPVLMNYSIAVVTDYVFRGVDVFSSVYTTREEEQSAFNVAPAIQPSVTFFSGAGFWFNFWGSFAVTGRDEDTATGFTGLAGLDELDTTLGYDWSNKLGSFSVGIVDYALIHPGVQGTPGSDIQEMFFKWGLPVMESLKPLVSHFVNSDTSATYTALTISGGEGLTWSANAGYGSAATQGLQDITATIAYDLGGGLGVNANVAYRPTPALVGYSSDGKYASAKDGSAADYPPALVWIGVSWGGEVK